MATRALSTTQNGPVTAKTAAQDAESTPINTSAGALSTLDALSNNITTWAKDVLDRLFPPEQREALLAKIKAFVLTNPKVSAFLGMNIALTGIPLGLFILFGLSVTVWSVLGGIVLGLLGAVLFSLTCIGIALIFVFPVLMFTTASACFLFLFGLGGYKILKWVSGRDKDHESSSSGQDGTTVGDSLNAITGGRLGGLLHSAEKEHEKANISGFSDEKTPPKPSQTPHETEMPTKLETTEPGTGKTAKTTAPQKLSSTPVKKVAKTTPISSAI